MANRHSRSHRTRSRAGSGLIVALSLGLLLLGSSLAMAQNVTVITEDDRRLTGTLIEEDDQQIVLDIAGIRTPIQRDQVAEIVDDPTPEDFYRDRREALDDDDIPGRVALVHALIRMSAYDLAAREIDDLREDFPDNDEFDRLSRAIEARRQFEAEREAENADDRADTATRTQPRTPANRLTQEQINRIRVYEVDLREQPRIHVPRETLDKLFTRYSDHDRIPRDRARQAAIRRAPGHEQLALIFDVQARELYGEVIVRHEPLAMRGFRSIHRQYVLNYCATNQCHGGDTGAGDLTLFNTYGNTDATVYTNFYLLNEYATPQGRMIDRETPERSLLLQFGLMRDTAVHPHPEVPEWRPHFRNMDDAHFRRFTEAIGQLYQPTPDYGIDFTYTPPAERDAETPDNTTENNNSNATNDDATNSRNTNDQPAPSAD